MRRHIFALALSLALPAGALAAPKKDAKEQAVAPAGPPAKYYTLAVGYEPGGKKDGWRFRVAGRRFAVDKKLKKNKLFSSLEILGTVKEGKDAYQLDAWLRLEISTSPTGGKGMESCLLKTVYTLKLDRKTEIFRSQGMSVWLKLGPDRKVAAPPPADNGKIKVPPKTKPRFKGTKPPI